MTPRSISRLVPRACLLVGCALASAGQAADRLALDHAAIVTDAAQPFFVQYAVEELVGYLKESTGNDVPVSSSPDSAGGVRILVGTKTVRQLLPRNLPDEKLGEEGYVLKSVSKDGVEYLVVTGRSPRGTKIALATLMKAVRIEGKSAFVPALVDVRGKPAFAKRGLHFNGWAFKSPYSFRNWREEDWHSYLDILAYQGVNLFYLWPFMEIMPLPLSPEDQAYLEECRRVVDYAQKKHGMEVWIMQCTNRVAQDRCGVADPRLRPYWRASQKDLNPAEPQDFQAIMASREAMYRIINNADGVCNIDSDPGFCLGSPLGDYVKVLQGCRALLDRHNLHGKEAKLIQWMLWGWGREIMRSEGLEQHQLLTVRAVKQGLPEPLWFMSGTFGWDLPICRGEGLIARTVCLQYGVIEGEPAYPRTNVSMAAIRGMFDGTTEFPELAGVMGNMQTPLLQFPNMFFFTSVMSDFDYRTRSEEEALLDLSRHLYPEHKQLMADGFLALKEDDPTKMETRIDQLDRLVREDRLGRLGIFGRKLFPDHRIVARSLLAQLRLRAAYQRLLLGISPTTPRAECERLLGDCLDAYLAWDLMHGWHDLWGWQNWVLAAFPTPPLVEKLRKTLDSKSEVDACFEQVARRLSAKYDANIVQEGCVAPLKKAVLSADRN